MRGGSQELDMPAWLGRVALELIGQGALGYSFDPLVADRPDTYADALKSLVYALPPFPFLAPVSSSAPFSFDSLLRTAAQSWTA